MRWASQGHPANFRRMVLSRLASNLMVYTVFIRCLYMSSHLHVPSCSIIYPTNIAVNIPVFTIEQTICLQSWIILMSHIPPSPHPSPKKRNEDHTRHGTTLLCATSSECTLALALFLPAATATLEAPRRQRSTMMPQPSRRQPNK